MYFTYNVDVVLLIGSAKSYNYKYEMYKNWPKMYPTICLMAFMESIISYNPGLTHKIFGTSSLNWNTFLGKNVIWTNKLKRSLSFNCWTEMLNRHKFCFCFFYHRLTSMLSNIPIQMEGRHGKVGKVVGNSRVRI